MQMALAVAEMSALVVAKEFLFLEKKQQPLGLTERRLIVCFWHTDDCITIFLQLEPQDFLERAPVSVVLKGLLCQKCSVETFGLVGGI